MTESTISTASEFEGITATECCINCTPDRCCISGSNFCGHPNKGGGTQPALQRNPEAIKRYNAARRDLLAQRSAARADREAALSEGVANV